MRGKTYARKKAHKTAEGRATPQGWRRQDQEALVWEDLCEVARKVGLEIRQDTLPEETRLQGGVIRMGERRICVVEARLPLRMKARVMMDVLRTIELGDVYMPPYLRELLFTRENER